MEHITSYMIRARNNCIYMTSRKFILFQLLRAGAQCYCMMIPSTYYSQRRTNDNLALHSTCLSVTERLYEQSWAFC